jgi:hypothetical protein|tara:strand:+ start:890 stop:1024 length:135 start_codon:yes stop_codon:yes gene_type:complete
LQLLVLARQREWSASLSAPHAASLAQELAPLFSALTPPLQTAED